MGEDSRTVEARAPRLSFTEMTEIMLPQHSNAIGTVFGGTVMAWIDVCGSITAGRHCQRTAVTAAVDDLVFLAPIRVGDIVVLKGRVNAAFHTSVEVEVTVEIEHRVSQERRMCVQALMTFVAVDAAGRPTPVPPLLPMDEDDARRHKEAQRRRDARLAKKR
jgi:acyl-CoA hydrolase